MLLYDMHKDPVLVDVDTYISSNHDKTQLYAQYPYAAL